MKKLFVTLAAFLVAGLCVFAVGTALASSSPTPTSTVSTLPRLIEQSSPCPATGCASGACHGFDDVPSPDGEHEMVCPEAGCASLECHAMETLVNRYHQASDASLNLWIVMPVVLVLGLAFIIKEVR